jgi:Protein of unknown function (DUF742)
MADDPPPVSGVRPYLITGGRVRPIDSKLHFEAQVLTTWEGRAALDRLAYEHHDVVAMCVRPAAVAEIAALLGLHLGVARVVVADLVAFGYLNVRQHEQGGAKQGHIIERVIRGLTAIR